MELERILNRDVRFPEVPAGYPAGPIRSNLRLKWLKEETHGAKGEAKTDLGKKRQRRRDRRGGSAKKAKVTPEPPASSEPMASGQGPAGSSTDPPRSSSVTRVEGDVGLRRARSRLAKGGTRKVIFLRPNPAHKEPERWPVLFVTAGKDQWALDWCAALGATGDNAPLDVRALEDKPQHRCNRECCGESGWLLEKAVANEYFGPLMEAVCKRIVQQRGRPGGAIVAIHCTSGMHRSVLMATLFSHALIEWGWRVEVRHLGRRHKCDCVCGSGHLVDRCPAVLRCLKKDFEEKRPGQHQALQLANYGDHLIRRHRAMSTFLKMVATGFHRAGMEHALMCERM